MEEQGCLACCVSSFSPLLLSEETQLTYHLFCIEFNRARDSVQLKTTYKSPTSVHVFSFSTDDHGLFPSIPPVDPLVIRTQVDLQGWSIEALSPNTTQVTLLEQSDPKGWSSKTSIPQTMANGELLLFFSLVVELWRLT